MMGKASAALTLLSVALLGWAGYQYVVDSRQPTGPVPDNQSGPALVVHDPEQDLGSRPSGEVLSARFHVANVSAKPVHVLGVAPCCGLNGCATPKRMDPFVLPAGGEVEIEYVVSIGEPGPFKCQPYLVYQDGGIQSLKMVVTGTRVDAVPEPSTSPGANHDAAAAR
jgi:hypothetical protein